MTKLFKYLKPFAAGIVLTIALLFVQAFSDLNLPNYMSRIVNVGIQQGGIEHAAPDAISGEGKSFIEIFMSSGERELVDSSYSQADKYMKKYPRAEGSIYLRDSSLDAETLDELDMAFSRATWAFIYTVEELSQGDGGADRVTLSTEEIDTRRLYEFGTMLEDMPGELVDSSREKAMSLDEASAKQGGIILTSAFLKELGVNLVALQRNYTIKIGLYMLGIALIGGVATVLVSFLSARIAAAFARNLRKDLFSKIESFSSTEFDNFSTASLITRCTNDVTQMQMVLMIGIRLICYSPIMGIGGVILAVGKSTSMSWIIAVACIVLLGLIMIVMAVAMPRFKIIQSLIDRLNLVSRENLSGLMVIRAFGTQKHEEDRFEEANAELTRTNLFVNRVMVFMMPLMNLIMNTVTILIIWVGSKQIAQSRMQVGDMMAFMQYAMYIIMSFLMLSMVFVFIPRAAVSAERIAEVLQTEPSIKDPENPKPPVPDKAGYVEFKNVSFHYEGAENEALSDINFTARPGETTAIIGATGSGKSTIANLALRFHDVTGGAVLVGGRDVRELRQEDLRRIIGFVPQKGVLLSGTIASNLKYGRQEAADEELQKYAEIAQASEFISRMEDGMYSDISQGGTNVSGGQRQRLSIARALAKEPDILIFDDSFSALDYRTDAALRRELKKHTGNATIIMIAQRVSTIMGAEQILVLDRGKIIGKGTHSELLKSCPEYFEIASSQMSGEEIA